MTFLLGVNHSGAEGGKTNPGKPAPHQYGERGIDYRPPNKADFIDIHDDMGFQVARLPFRLERFWPDPAASEPYPIAAADLDLWVNELDRRGLWALLDMHFLGAKAPERAFQLTQTTYQWEVVDGPSGLFPRKDLIKAWVWLARRYKDHPRVMLDFINEPHGDTGIALAGLYQDLIDAVRDAGFRGYLHIEPGNWSKQSALTPELLALKGDGLVYHCHVYSDKGEQGDDTSYVGDSWLMGQLQALEAKVRSVGRKAWLGEFGIVNLTTARDGWRRAIQYMSDADDAFLGATVWGYGYLWPETYINLVRRHPKSNAPNGALSVLREFLPPTGGGDAALVAELQRQLAAEQAKNARLSDDLQAAENVIRSATDAMADIEGWSKR
jgi:aryl-phospho-beta-D-glucosidase BglC (GH1 family)